MHQRQHRTNQDIVMQTKHFINACIHSGAYAISLELKRLSLFPIKSTNKPTKWSWYWTSFFRRFDGIFSITFNKLSGTAVEAPWYGRVQYIRSKVCTAFATPNIWAHWALVIKRKRGRCGAKVAEKNHDDGSSTRVHSVARFYWTSLWLLFSSLYFLQPTLDKNNR